jgi:ABC-type spermidine/putrescine transport system permease subunit I
MKRKDPQDAPARRMGSRERILLILPDTAANVLLLILPLAVILLYSVWTTDTATFTVKPLFTMENFQSIMQPIYLQALGRSVLITVSTVIGCILLGFPLAYFISQSPKKLQMALLLAVMVPFWTSFVVRTYAWLTLLAPSGAVTQFLSLVGIVSPDADLRYTQTAITIGMIYTYLPMMVLPLFATLEKLDPNLLAASADLGGSSVRTFFSVVVPQARSGIAAGCLLVAIPALGEYTIPAILGGGKTLMIGNVIASEFTTTGDYSRGAALAAILMIAVLLVVVGMQIAARKKGSRR